MTICPPAPPKYRRLLKECLMCKVWAAQFNTFVLNGKVCHFLFLADLLLILSCHMCDGLLAISYA